MKALFGEDPPQDETCRDAHSRCDLKVENGGNRTTPERLQRKPRSHVGRRAVSGLLRARQDFEIELSEGNGTVGGGHGEKDSRGRYWA